MAFQADSDYARFVRRRDRLNAQLDEGRSRIGQWIQEHETKPASAAELAYLEGLLKARRDLLAELIALDDEFMGHLLDLMEQDNAEEKQDERPERPE